jgi:hypothetical protein
MSYNTSFSLEKLREDPNFAALFAKKAVEVKKNKADLVEAAQSYQSKYKKEIEEGTKKRQLMLAEGESRGLKETEIFKDNQLFIPTQQTPILNYLYFLLREEKDQDAAIKVLRAAEDLDKELSVLKEEFEKKYGQEQHDHKTSDAVPNMVSYIYGNIGDDTMATLKKLKTLAMGENEKEAFVAFRKGRELAQKYKLDWDKIAYNR